MSGEEEVEGGAFSCEDAVVKSRDSTARLSGIRSRFAFCLIVLDFVNCRMG